jgi:hypothetical protein
MTETHTKGRDLQADILKTVRKGQTAVVEAIQAWTSKVQSLTPEMPEFNMPFADKLPKPQALVASAYDFAEQLLADQRKFAEDVLKATAPMRAAKDDAPAKKKVSAAK